MRADVYLSEKQYVKSRSAARTLIEEGAVLVNGRTVKKPSEQIDESVENTVEITKTEKYVGIQGGARRVVHRPPQICHGAHTQVLLPLSTCV